MVNQSLLSALPLAPRSCILSSHSFFPPQQLSSLPSKYETYKSAVEGKLKGGRVGGFIQASVTIFGQVTPSQFYIFSNSVYFPILYLSQFYMLPNFISFHGVDGSFPALAVEENMGLPISGICQSACNATLHHFFPHIYRSTLASQWQFMAVSGSV